ncbi:MAG: hypothetical protein ACI9EZ_001251 [Halobacteriales archaeon]|jgi:hypothetical protein
MFPPGFMYDHYSTDSYITSITTNGTVENATVSLPFPAGEDVAPDFDSTLWIHDDEGNRLTDWNPRIADTAHGPMLRLEPGRLVGEIATSAGRTRRMARRSTGGRSAPTRSQRT